MKVGTSKNQGKAVTPLIACEGEAVLTFRVAPWEGDSLFNVSINGGTTSDKTGFELKQHQWTDVTIRITDITSGIKITFSSLYKHRFFLDDVCVRPAKDGEEGIEWIAGKWNNGRKILLNGALIIELPDGAQYNATGARVR